MQACQPDIARLAGFLGYSCDAPAGLVHLHNPLSLTNWTLPVVEVLMITGAALALWFAVRRLRRDGDPSSLVLWLASLIYVVMIEPPQHSPGALGISRQLGVICAHNIFTVDFFHNSLPLYIVALYPATVTLAFDVVRSVGIFARRGVLIGAVCTGFVHGCFYEVFDHLGPQLRWWVWNDGNPLNHPALGSVPVASMVNFAMLGPAALGLGVYLLVTRPYATGRATRRGAMLWQIPVIGLLAPLVMLLLSVPSLLLIHHGVARSVLFAVEIIAFVVISVPVLVQEWRATRRGAGTRYPSSYVRIFGALYLLTFAALWLSALPDFAGAIDGITGTGTPVGNLPYAAACFVISLYCVAGVSTLADAGRTSPPEPASDCAAPS
jgi:hypothetical protein